MKQFFIGMMPYLTIGRRGTYIKPINMLDVALDNRITYTGPSHIYYAEDGSIATSLENVWPLEYQNGVAVGRHEPERASQNLLPDTSFATGIWTKSSGSTWTTESTELGVSGIIGDLGNVYTAAYNSTTSAFVATDLNGGTPADWTPIIRKFNTPLGAIRWYPARQSSGLYIYGSISNQVPAGNYVASVMRKADSLGIHSALPQVEAGLNRTSPIINTGTSQTATRAASSVTITEPLASTAVIHFSNGEVDEISGAGVFTIPVGTYDWSTRYIQSISFE